MAKQYTPDECKNLVIDTIAGMTENKDEIKAPLSRDMDIALRDELGWDRDDLLELLDNLKLAFDVEFDDEFLPATANDCLNAVKVALKKDNLLLEPGATKPEAMKRPVEKRRKR